MPTVIKKRPAKKKAAKEDEVKNAALQALDKLKERQKQLIIVASLAVAAIILYSAFALYSSSVSNKAYSLEKEAYKYYYKTDEAVSDEDRWKRALELYKKSVDVKVTPTALFFVGNCYYNLRDYDNAIKEYSRFADKFSNDNGILPLVYQKLASAYFKTNQNDKALETLGRLSKINNGIFKDTALILEAKYYERAGQKENALQKYREIITGFPSSPWSVEASSKVSAEEAAHKSDTSGMTPAAPPTELKKDEPAKNPSEGPAAK